MDEIKDSWKKNHALQTIIQDLQVDPASLPHYKWVNELLNKKEKIMVGQNPDLQAKPIVVYHATIIKDHLGMIVTSKQVGSLFYWKR